ncbi:IclR family transcriptional regulator [Candidimonas nitroreducens]|uniref:IclR family transcriptional regulator n=1 Tax=Candidimonas nitroreducens TaxID=683354 RepID=A0A225M6U7_9BURK|nr:IclR family transcriptional regulator [Candidimonas nitroreducens]OWT56846.1 IclR family transcriptional regulator [Candidimonas nitroreducens]
MPQNGKALLEANTGNELSGSLLKGFAILELLAHRDEPLGVTEIARHLGIPKSGIHRVLQVMCGAGWLKQTEHGLYDCSLKLWELGQRIADRIDLRRIAAALMRDLAQRTQETVHLSVLDNNEVLYLDKLDSSQAIRAYTRVGGRAPAYCVATGRAMLAYADAATVAAATHHMETFTALTVKSRRALDKELARVRHQGYAINRGEWRGGVRGLAAPVFDSRGDVVAAIGIAGPGERLTDTTMQSMAPMVVGAARSLSGELGYAPHLIAPVRD